MSKKIISIMFSCVLAFCCLLGLSTVSGSKDVYAASTYSRYTTESLNIRKEPSASSKLLGAYDQGTKVTCYGTSGKWTIVKFKGNDAYVATRYLTDKKVKKTTGDDVASYALRFVGNPYVWGGESLTRGADCSGFTKSVYAHFGYSLTHSSIDQRNYGRAVSWRNKKAGDLICYNAQNGIGHVGIYIGNNRVVHAGSARTGIHTSPANFRSVWGVRRIVK